MVSDWKRSFLTLKFVMIFDSCLELQFSALDYEYTCAKNTLSMKSYFKDKDGSWLNIWRIGSYSIFWITIIYDILFVGQNGH